MTDEAVQVAETLQTASLHHPPQPSESDGNPKPQRDHRFHRVPSASDAASISTDIVTPRRTVGGLPQRPPVPDLRFEQSYLVSLKGADTWGRIAWITTRDHLLLPLIQGTLWTLALSGLRYWNRGARVSGWRVGSSMRQLWWRITNWQPARA